MPKKTTIAFAILAMFDIGLRSDLNIPSLQPKIDFGVRSWPQYEFLGLSFLRFFTWVGKCHGKYECGGKEGGGGGSARRFLGTNRNVFNHLGMDFAKSGIRFQIL